MKLEAIRTPLRALVVLLAALAAFTALVCVLTFNRSVEIANEEVDRYLSELSQQTASKIDQRMAFNLELLSNLGDQMEIAKDGSEAAALIEPIVEQGPYVWIGYTNKGGLLTVPGKDPIDASGYPAVASALADQASVSESLVSVFGDEAGALYAVPGPEGSAIGAVVGWIPPETMKVLVDTETTDGLGYSHIVSAAGDFILRSTNESVVMHGPNTFSDLTESIKADEASIVLMKQNMAEGKIGSLRFTAPDGTEREINYRPLAQGDWYVLSVVPPKAYTSLLTTFTAQTIVGMGVLALVLVGAFGAFLVWSSGKKNREISRIAFVDPVTGGHTTAKFDQLAADKTKEGAAFSLVALDIQNFRLINDTFGKAQGDALLRHVHRIIVEGLEPGEQTARISADIFNVILDETDPDKVRSWTAALADRINAFNTASNESYLIKINCGACLADDPDLDIVTLRDRSNTARKSVDATVDRLYTCAFYNDTEHDRLLREKDMENAMESALIDDEFVIYLQPKISLDTGKTIGAEALVRWNSKARGLIPPDQFIPLFERNSFILKLDLHVFEQTCALVRSWIDKGHTPLRVSVNLSPVHLRHPGFLGAYEAIRQRHDVPAGLLELELTESTAIENLELLRDTVDRIHEYGFYCSMDDFGSGYSSLNVLKDIPVDTLKIDRAFFSTEGPRTDTVVKSVVDMARQLGMSTVAEGVETIPQVDFLRSVQCDAVQGYVFSAPVPVELFEKMTFEDEE